MASARRRAAARLLLGRDASERALLADEASRLRAARAEAAAANDALGEASFPDDLARPAKGTIVRHFGTLEHERSHAALSRRGVDFEVDGRAVAVAPAAGVVRYAGPIRGLDNGIIIDHGSYLTVVGKLGELAPVVGTRVDRGDRLGHAARHRVYLEVRIKVGPAGMNVDPEPRLVK
jgi:septal ring factor EnvC (AmiA/AmiB activator)